MRPPPVTKSTPASRFRPIIEAAIASGADMSQQELQLTYGDTLRLKRDSSVRVEDISFSGGVMTFLGVRVVEGAATSALAEVVIIPPNPVEIEVAAMAKGQKKSNKEIRKPKKEKPKPVPAVKSFASPPMKTK